MQRIAGTLAQAGFLVTLVGRQLPQSKPLQTQAFGQHRFSCFFNKGALFYVEYNIRLMVWFLIHRFDIYGTVDADTALAGLVSTAWRRRPLVFDAHELFPEMPEVVHRKRVKAIWAWLEQKAFQKASLAYTVSTGLVHYFEQKYQRQVHLIRNLPLQKDISYIAPADKPYFIYQGALNVGRGIENTIRAMEQISAHLMICGDGPLAADLKSLVKELGLEEKVQFMGNVPPSELALLTQRAHAGIMLLDNQGLSYYYSLANKFFDYVQAGIPQVCVAFPEYVALNAEHEVALLVQNQLPAVVEAMQSLLDNQVLYHALQMNCQQARLEWTWENEAVKLVELYKNLI